MPGSDLVAEEEAWADHLSLGVLHLTGVPVTEASPSQVMLGSPQFAASLGMASLSRLDVIVDGQHGVAYVRSKLTRPPTYEHNRLGAVFMPTDTQSDSLVARVLEGSPAYEAGVRNGDILLRVGKLDVSHWRTDPQVRSNSFFRERPAGTKFVLTLERGTATLTATVVLRDILTAKHTKS